MMIDLPAPGFAGDGGETGRVSCPFQILDQREVLDSEQIQRRRH